MTENVMEYSANKREMYEEVVLQMGGLFDDCPHVLANLANAAALLNQAMTEINWVGFYLLKSEPEQEEIKDEILVLGPFQGKPACVEIKVGKGVCGRAVARDDVILVEDVHEFAGHIACDEASRSEIVLPIHANGMVVAVLDIDSPVLSRFDEEDKEGLLEVVRVIEEMLEHSGNCLL